MQQKNRSWMASGHPSSKPEEENSVRNCSLRSVTRKNGNDHYDGCSKLVEEDVLKVLGCRNWSSAQKSGARELHGHPGGGGGRGGGGADGRN